MALCGAVSGCVIRIFGLKVMVYEDNDEFAAAEQGNGKDSGEKETSGLGL